jgi:hypothetical protein
VSNTKTVKKWENYQPGKSDSWNKSRIAQW